VRPAHRRRMGAQRLGATDRLTFRRSRHPHMPPTGHYAALPQLIVADRTDVPRSVRRVRLCPGEAALPIWANWAPRRRYPRLIGTGWAGRSMRRPAQPVFALYV
jgi:hypothetical protein